MTAEDEKLKFTITSKNRELQEKARQQEEEIKLEFAKKEEAYSQEIRELEHKVSDLGSEAREKEQTIRKHKSDKVGFEEDLWETVNRYARVTRLDPALAARKKKVEWSSEHIRELDERFNGAREKTDDQKKKILELASLKSEVEQLEFEKYRLDRQKAETIARKAQTKNLLESLRKVDPQSHLGAGPGPDLDWNTELQRAEQLLAVEKKKLQEATLSAQEVRPAHPVEAADGNHREGNGQLLPAAALHGRPRDRGAQRGALTQPDSPPAATVLAARPNNSH